MERMIVASVRHHLCRIDFDPSDITGTSTIRVFDLDGVEIDTVEVRTTHLISAVTKLMMVQVRRHAVLAKMIGEMDDEINGNKESTMPDPQDKFCYRCGKTKNTGCGC